MFLGPLERWSEKPKKFRLCSKFEAEDVLMTEHDDELEHIEGLGDDLETE